MKTKQSPEILKKELKAAGWRLYLNDAVFKTIPNRPVEAIQTFTLGRYVSDDELAKEYESRSLVPATPYDIAQYVLAFPDFQERYIGTHWKDENGEWCYLAFDRWGGERSVYCRRHTVDWGGRWWLAGVPAPSKPSGLSISEKTSDTQSFVLGDLVDRAEGEYSFPGTVVSVFKTTKGATRYVVEMEGYGLLHIFGPKSIKRREV